MRGFHSLNRDIHPWRGNNRDPSPVLCQAWDMARGWESKAVESQMEAAVERRGATVAQRRLEDVALERERESLQLSRTRVLQDLAAAQNPRYRELLERSLKYLDEKIASLSPASKPSHPE